MRETGANERGRDGERELEVSEMRFEGGRAGQKGEWRERGGGELNVRLGTQVCQTDGGLEGAGDV